MARMIDLAAAKVIPTFEITGRSGMIAPGARHSEPREPVFGPIVFE